LYLLLTLGGLIVAALLTLVRMRVSGAELGGLIAGFVLTQAIVLVVAWMRIARLFALMQVAQRLAPVHSPLRN
jgi:hypothetical protein